MLFPYIDDYQKITMGLFSYIEDMKEPKRILEEIQWYSEDPGREIHLWKSEETGDFVGLIGSEMEDEILLIRAISVSPSYRNEGIATAMIEAINEKHSDYKLAGTLETAPLITKWQKLKSEE